jgi:hypothetical protein
MELARISILTSRPTDNIHPTASRWMASLGAATKTFSVPAMVRWSRSG